MADANIWHAIDKLTSMVTLLGIERRVNVGSLQFAAGANGVVVTDEQRLGWLRQLKTDGSVEHPNFTWQFTSIDEEKVILLGTAIFGGHWVVFNIGHSGMKYTTRVWHVEVPVRMEETSLEFEFAHEVIKYLNSRFPQSAAGTKP